MKRLLLVALLGLALGAFVGTAQAVPKYKILDMRVNGGQMVANVQHFRPDGSHWFYENYTWQGREGVKRTVETTLIDSNIMRLMDNGQVAPYEVLPDGSWRQYLPVGRTWLFTANTPLDADAILSVIASVHTQRTAAGYAGNESNRAASGSSGDTAGATHLHSIFNYLIGTEQ